MNFIRRVNDWIALRMTLIFGTMWMTYLFFIYGFLPLLFPQQEVNLLYWSNTVQLWSLPLLMVGTNLLGKKSEERAQQDHEMIKSEFEAIRNLNTALLEELAETKAMHQELHTKHTALLHAVQALIEGGEQFD
ncbi:hypothetical protein ACOJUR_11990 [Alicyclobacillus tolerans]|uniref:hypothetical protein n=1 Tax=Alicyclobacillus tolerans TaxID=90970 RepID=UPI003B8232B9